MRKKILVPISLALMLAASAADAARSPARGPAASTAPNTPLSSTACVTAMSATCVGCGGRRVSHLTIGREKRATYSWRGRGTYGANLTLTFRNDRLTDKLQLGLSAD
ncbi:hypothetical protein [Methylobacterium sp. D48H]